ncbi:copper resistance protein NlpE (plasmid) [Photobacterium sp. DA100]|uniref:copper resistance protein NlpE n=1 Tax=Photobacterium sp. DA100 TaxID=3027472 RepID=UPI00247AD17F|nr:copper resistance protein NlpE [Photobacterium sp. DA100]WEM45081.1 copper resistance protein NlpE [Photobacterium sp. DA100]
MKKTLLALVVAGFVLTGCDQKATPESPSQTETDTAVVVENQVQADDASTAEVPVTLPEIEQPEVAQPVADSAHSARNALDWDGTYTGILPCADCEGIKTELIVKKDGTFILTEVYLGKEDNIFEYEGSFNWNNAGNTIALPGAGDDSVQYFVGENQLFRLDQEGNRVTGDLADHYVLRKQ